MLIIDSDDIIGSIVCLNKNSNSHHVVSEPTFTACFKRTWTPTKLIKEVNRGVLSSADKKAKQ